MAYIADFHLWAIWVKTRIKIRNKGIKNEKNEIKVFFNYKLRKSKKKV